MKEKLKKIVTKNLMLTILILILASYGTFTLAKYIIEEFHGYYLSAKHFYFTSNRLKKDMPTYLINNWSGVGAFNISFDVLSEKNRYVYSEFDIPYDVTFNCPDDVICSLDKEHSVIYSSNPNHSDTVTLSVNPTRNYNEGERLTLSISATSNSPYVETISAKFDYVVGKQGVTYEIEDEPNRVYLILKITNAITYCRVSEAFDEYEVGDFIDNNIYKNLPQDSKNKCIGKKIDLSFDPNLLRIDTTNGIITSDNYTQTEVGGTNYVNTLSINVNPVSTTAIKFYKTNISQNYTYPIVNSNSIIGVNIHD